ncbi:alpha/beta hydrolase [Luteococcus peritonei]|uniref:Alpha/beta fold hydrolase n=1 Tax=Luteococcus peritonei TaxID=88874 RepID=A0ABW4RVC8_9ACTN
MIDPRGQVGRFAGRWMHWRERRGDGPAVVLMSGCGLAMEYWRELNRLLEGRHVLAYDRPGMGGTRWPGRMPTLLEEVDSLAALLDSRGVRGAVLVAHSMASFHAEALARIRPDLVSGIVMVDGSVEWYSRAPSTPTAGLATRGVELVDTLNLNRLAGLVWRLGTALQSTWQFSRLGYGRLPAIYADRQSLLMATAESFAYEHQGWDLQQLRTQRPWPAVPVVVLSAADSDGGREIPDQLRLARLLGGGQVVVDGSKHLMMLDRPDAIARAVKGLR